jgi:hypothetical protein
VSKAQGRVVRVIVSQGATRSLHLIFFVEEHGCKVVKDSDCLLDTGRDVVGVSQVVLDSGARAARRLAKGRESVSACTCILHLLCPTQRRCHLSPERARVRFSTRRVLARAAPGAEEVDFQAKVPGAAAGVLCSGSKVFAREEHGDCIVHEERGDSHVSRRIRLGDCADSAARCLSHPVTSLAAHSGEETNFGEGGELAWTRTRQCSSCAPGRSEESDRQSLALEPVTPWRWCCLWIIGFSCVFITAFNIHTFFTSDTLVLVEELVLVLNHQGTTLLLGVQVQIQRKDFTTGRA